MRLGRRAEGLAKERTMHNRANRPTRREFLMAGAAGMAGLLLGGLRLRAAEAEAAGKIPVGLQLYSVRGECGKDGGKNLPKVIEAVAKMGYEGVEFAGYYGWDAQALKKMLDDNGVKCCGTHTGLDTLLGDKLKQTVEFHKTIGNKFLIVPSMGGGYTKDAEAWKRTARLFNEIAARLKPEGMYCGYHNHSSEFKPMDGSTPWDIFYGNTVKDVVMQLDTGNCMGGKGDPVALLEKYPGRALTIHCKEFGGTGMGLVGDGKVDWKQIIQLGRTTACTKWFIIEHESGGAAALEAVKGCLAKFRKLLA
jgi:sugar phosphate isomerase/epimerase